MQVVPQEIRAISYGRVTKTVTQYPACAARVKVRGLQCTHVATGSTGSNQGGRMRMPTGETVWLCGTHFDKALTEGWEPV